MGDVWIVVIAVDNAPLADNIKNEIRNWYKRKGFGFSFYHDIERRHHSFFVVFSAQSVKSMKRNLSKVLFGVIIIIKFIDNFERKWYI